MSHEIERKDYGMTSKGAVTMITFADNDPDEPDSTGTLRRYQVRHGVRTIGDYSKAGDADLAAKAIAKSE